LQEVEVKLAEKNRIAAKRDMLETLQEIHQSLVSLKQLLKQAQAQAMGSAADASSNNHHRTRSSTGGNSFALLVRAGSLVSLAGDDDEERPSKAQGVSSDAQAVFSAYLQALEENNNDATGDSAPNPLLDQALLLERASRQLAVLKALVKKGVSVFLFCFAGSSDLFSSLTMSRWNCFT
jgi:hypothetical protein